MTTASDVRGLRLRGLTVEYPARPEPVRAVRGVDLTLEPGRVLALLGPSGCGKSSLLRAVAGLEPAGGKIEWDGANIAGTPVHKRGFGMVFQDGQLFPHRTVAGNIAYGLRGMPREEARARVEQLLELVGLTGLEDRRVQELSGGQAQRVALARSLAPSPRLLLLDEPLSALDRSLREYLASELREILTKTSTTAIYVTHDQDEAFTVADYVGVMLGGHLAALDTPARLWADPPGRDVAKFLGFGPFVDSAIFGADDGVSGPDRAEGGALLGLGPAALHLCEQSAPGSVRASVVSRGLRRGVYLLGVELPGGEVAQIRVPLGRKVPEVGEITHVALTGRDQAR